MKTMQVKKILIILFFSLINFAIFAQDCKDIVQRAEVAYKKGHFNDVKEILVEECIKVLPLDTEKEQAYYLLTLSNLYLKDTDEAKKSMLNILNQNPEYICLPESPVIFQKFYNSFKITPFVVFGGRIGFNSSQITSTKLYSLDNIDNAKNGSYQSKVGLNIQAMLAIQLYKKIDLLAEIGFKQFNYLYKNTQFKYSKIEFTEKQSLLELPILLKYNFGNNYNFKRRRKNFWQHFNPYVIGGFSATYLLSSKGTIKREDKFVDNTTITLNSPEFNITAMRNAFAFYAIGGIGLDYKKYRGIFSLECRYSYGLSPIIKPATRYTNTEMALGYGYLDNDINFGNLTIMAGYSIPLYRPRQIKEFFADEINIKK